MFSLMLFCCWLHRMYIQLIRFSMSTRIRFRATDVRRYHSIDCGRPLFLSLVSISHLSAREIFTLHYWCLLQCLLVFATFQICRFIDIFIITAFLFHFTIHCISSSVNCGSVCVSVCLSPRVSVCLHLLLFSCMVSCHSSLLNPTLCWRNTPPRSTIPGVEGFHQGWENIFATYRFIIIPSVIHRRWNEWVERKHPQKAMFVTGQTVCRSASIGRSDPNVGPHQWEKDRVYKAGLRDHGLPGRVPPEQESPHRNQRRLLIPTASPSYSYSLSDASSDARFTDWQF